MRHSTYKGTRAAFRSLHATRAELLRRFVVPYVTPLHLLGSPEGAEACAKTPKFRPDAPRRGKNTSGIHRALRGCARGGNASHSARALSVLPSARLTRVRPAAPPSPAARAAQARVGRRARGREVRGRGILTSMTSLSSISSSAGVCVLLMLGARARERAEVRGCGACAASGRRASPVAVEEEAHAGLGNAVALAEGLHELLERRRHLALRQSCNWCAGIVRAHPHQCASTAPSRSANGVGGRPP